MVYDKDVPLDNYWGFIDGTVLSTSRPNIRQIFSYNYHKRYYALKFQLWQPMVSLRIYMDQ